MARAEKLNTDALVVMSQFAEEMIDTLHDINERIPKSYNDDFSDLPRHIKNLTILARAATNAAVLLMTQVELQEGRRELATLREKIDRPDD